MNNVDDYQSYCIIMNSFGIKPETKIEYAALVKELTGIELPMAQERANKSCCGGGKVL